MSSMMSLTWWHWVWRFESSSSLPSDASPSSTKKRTTIKKIFFTHREAMSKPFQSFLFVLLAPSRISLFGVFCSLPRRDKTTLLEAKVAHAQTCFITFLQVNRWRSFRLNVIKPHKPHEYKSFCVFSSNEKNLTAVEFTPYTEFFNAWTFSEIDFMILGQKLADDENCPECRAERNRNIWS